MSCSTSSTRGAVHEWEGGGTAPNSSVNVTCISRQCFVLGQLDGSLLAGDPDSKWEGELPNAYDSCRAFALWGGTSMGPSVWELAPDVLFPRSLDLAAIWHEISGCELKPKIQSFNVGTKALARNKTNHLVWVRHILVTLFGTPFICHQWGSLSDMGVPPTLEER